MAWKARGQSTLLPNLGHEKTRTMRPHKLPTMKRGGGLRVGRVVSDIRSSNNDTNWGNQQSSPFVQEEERRVQDELIEILTVKLANKEKEVELLKVKQNNSDRELGGHNRQVQLQQEEHDRAVSELVSANQELQRKVQLLQIRCEQLQVESEVQRTAAIEQRRLREKDQAQVRLDSRAHQKIVDNQQRELQRGFSDRNILENKMQQILREHQAQNSEIVRLETKCGQLEEKVQASQEAYQQFQENLAAETRRRGDAESHVRRLEEEKLGLEEKQRALVKNLKVVSSRAADVEKKRSELSRVEDGLTQQLAALKNKNVELKARKGQITSQTKHLHARIASLENANAAQEHKLEGTTMELESTRKYCRDSQFRIKQLQEEIVYLKNRKPTITTATESTDKSSPAPESPSSPPAREDTITSEADDEVPVWMKG